MPPAPTRRAALAAGLAALLGDGAAAQPRPSVHVLGWTSALETLRAQIAEFVGATGIAVRHQHVPWIAYRAALLAQLRAGSGADIAWVSDAWLPELAEGGLLEPLTGMPALTRFNAEAAPACTEAMRHGGQQYGLAYYTDSIAFFYNHSLLGAAGIATPPTSWEEVMDQCRHIQSRQLAAYPLGLPLAADPWLVELLSALVFAHGGRFVADGGEAVMAHPGRGILPALTLLRDMVHRHRAVHPQATGQTEVTVAEAFAQGRHAFALLPSYRLRFLNDRFGSEVAGAARTCPMPMGGAQQQPATCGWVRFWAMSRGAGGDAGRRERAIAFLQAFGGRDAAGEYSMQRRLFAAEGLPFCTLPLLDDPQVQALMVADRESPEWRAMQQASARNKDVIAPWFGDWQGATNPLWQAVAQDRLAPHAAAGRAEEAWLRLRAAWQARR